jgi:hypothetical protein
MARPRKPTTVLELTGAYRKDPQRRADRANEPESLGPIGAAPLHFSEELKAIWNELVALASPGVLTVSDRLTVEVTCRMVLRVRREDSAWGSADVNVLMRCLSLMGMTPTDRSKVSVPKKLEAQNTFAEIAADLRPN